MPKKLIKHEEELKNYDWIVLGRHPSAVLSGCLATRLGAKVLFLPNVGQAFKTSRDKGAGAEDFELDYESGWIGGFSSHRSPEEQGLLELCLNRIDPQLVQKWFSPEEQTFLFTQNNRILSEDFFNDWVQRFESGKSKKIQKAQLKIWADSEKDLVQTLNKIPSLLNTELPSKKPSTREEKNRIKSFFKLKALSFSSSIGRRLEKKWFFKKNSSLSFVKNRSLNREKLEILTARFAESSGILLKSEDLAQAGLSDWACFYASRLRRIKLNVNDWIDDLLRIAQTQGASIDAAADIESIIFQSNRYNGIEYIPGKEEDKIRVSSHGLVCGTSTVFLEIHLCGKKKNKISKKSKVKSTIKGWVFSWVFYAPAGSWEKSLPRRLLWSEIGSPPMEWEWDWLVQKGDEDKTVLRVRTILPWSEDSLHISYLMHILENVAEQAFRLFPGIDFLGFNSKTGVDGKSKTLRTDDHEDLLKKLYPWRTLESIPENVRIYFGKGTGVDSGVEGLFLTNETTYPALGSFGWSIAALESSAWLAHRLGMSGPLMDLSVKPLSPQNIDHRYIQK